MRETAVQMPGRIAASAQATQDRPDRSSSGGPGHPERSGQDGASRRGPSSPGKGSGSG